MSDFDSPSASAASSVATEPIPVLKPLLPSTEELLPYLQRIDGSRVYSNFGPLSQEFERRIGEGLGFTDRCVATTTNCTSGLLAAILSIAHPVKPDRPFALLPSFSFAASAVALERSGYEVYFGEIDPTTWSLDPAALTHHPMLDKIGVVLPVAPFGRPLPHDSWFEFKERTGIPVVIDAAAAFSVVERDPTEFLGALPTVFSFHATKGFGIGEGGCVISTDTQLISAIKRTLNFGFWGSRESISTSLNGKMSEYHAAVGLARFDSWPKYRSAMEAVSMDYRRRFEQIGRADAFYGFPKIDGGYAIFLCSDLDESRAVQRSLAADGIEFRMWYGRGIQRHAHFAEAPSDNLDATEALCERLIGLPMAPDLTSVQRERVVRAIYRAVE